MDTYTLHDVSVGLSHLGINKGDTLLVNEDLTYFGKCEDARSKQQVLETFFNTFFDLIGSDGTLVVPTWNTHITESKEPFIYEETPSAAGVFSEYVRQHPGSIRSLHPLMSYTAVGKNASFICDHVAKSAYGLETPFDRLLKLDSRAISMGLRARQTCSIVHHVEMMMGAPYRYHKEFTIPVFRRGQKIESEFYFFVRNLEADIQKDGNEKLFELFQKKGFNLKVSRIGNGIVESYVFRELYETCVELLKNDIYGLLKHPPEIRTYRT